MQILDSPPQIKPASHLRVGHVVLMGLPLVFLLGVVGVTGYFRLGSDTAALRESVMAPSSGQWHRKIAVHVGWFTTSLVRFGSRWLKLEAEPRAALESLHGVEVGVYELEPDGAPYRFNAALARADKAMLRRGWERIVGVSQEQQLVAVYLPHRALSTHNIKCCVLVFNGHDLVVASVRGNLEPLMAIAEKHLQPAPNNFPLALR